MLVAVFTRVHRQHRPSFRIGNDYNLFILLDRFVALRLWVRDCYIVVLFLYFSLSKCLLFDQNKKFSMRATVVCPIDAEYTRCTKIYGYINRLYTNQFNYFHLSFFSLFLLRFHSFRSLLPKSAWYIIIQSFFRFCISVESQMILYACAPFQTLIIIFVVYRI